MPRRRMIHDRIWRSETLAQLPRDARYLFIGLITTADDQGRRRGHPGLIRSDVFPLDDVSLDDISAWLDALERIGSIMRYNSDGIDLIQITGWWDYQTPSWAMPSDMPAPDGWTDRVRYRQGNAVVTRDWPGSEDTPSQSGPTVAPLPSQSETPDRASGSDSVRASGSDSLAAAAAGGPGFCRLHGVAMTQRRKRGETWWSHKLPDGRWCRGEGDAEGVPRQSRKYMSCPGCGIVTPVEALCDECGKCPTCCEHET